MTRPSCQRGFAYIAAVVLLVVLAALAGAVVRLNTVQITNTTLELQGIQATQAARAGIEWGVHVAHDAGNACRALPLAERSIGPQTLTDFAATGFRVTVTIRCQPFREGESAEGIPAEKIIYAIDSVACNGAGACPAVDAATVARTDYVERMRTATACTTASGAQADCYAN